MLILKLCVASAEAAKNILVVAVKLTYVWLPWTINWLLLYFHNVYDLVDARQNTQTTIL